MMSSLPPRPAMSGRAAAAGRAMSLGCAMSLGLAACGDDTPPAPKERTVSALRLIGQQVLPRRMDFQGTVVGGLSGGDYDAASGQYVFLSDDRTTTDSPNPPRMYTATLTFDAQSFSAGDHHLHRDAQAARRPGVSQGAGPGGRRSGVRAHQPAQRQLRLGQRGRSRADRGAAADHRSVHPRGVPGRQPPAQHPVAVCVQDEHREQGAARQRRVSRSLTFPADGSKLAVLAEGPLQEDGPAPTVDAGATARLTVITHATGAMAQYAYPIERVQAAPVPAGSFTVNGPSELLALTATRFLVLERSFSVGVVGNQVRLYEIDLTGASNVLNVPALSGEPFTPVSKRLILDFETLKDTLGGIANLECLTFGPKLANGHDSLVVVADDNFPTADSATDRNQFLVFEVIP
ncbi:MAG: esterase-like activity of phytase family protein [Myxococcales bacterium]|nr:esterase-like activity of phytase family protein [Myxococcales bacterium]